MSGLAASYLWPAFLALFGAGHNLGDCHSFDYGAGAVAECTYQASGDAGLEQLLLAEAGRYLNAGPWATDEDFRWPALSALIGKRPIMTNVELRGYGVVLRQSDQPGMVSAVQIDARPPTAMVEMRGRAE